MGSIFDAVLGRFFSSGVELELGAGVDCKDGILARRNASTRRIDLAPDHVHIAQQSWSWRGDQTDFAPGGPADIVACAIDGAATSIPIGSVVAAGYAVALVLRAWGGSPAGGHVSYDTIRFSLFRSPGSSTLYIRDQDSSGVASGTGELALDIDGDDSGATFQIGGSYSGDLTIARKGFGETATFVRASIWSSESWLIPTS